MKDTHGEVTYTDSSLPNFSLSSELIQSTKRLLLPFHSKRQISLIDFYSSELPNTPFRKCPWRNDPSCPFHHVIPGLLASNYSQKI